jgi:hypothetical protein
MMRIKAENELEDKYKDRENVTFFYYEKSKGDMIKDI